jgi:hypothetical protein
MSLTWTTIATAIIINNEQYGLCVDEQALKFVDQTSEHIARIALKMFQHATRLCVLDAV